MKLPPTLPSLALLLALPVALAPPVRADEAALAARVEQLAAEVRALQAQVAQLRHAAGPAAPEGGAATAAASAAPDAAATAAPADAQRLQWFGYGEINATRPTGAPTTLDVARFVLGAGVRFDERTRLASELEVEHAVSSADDAGEVEVEQAYIERDLRPGLVARAGLVLVPLGLLNDNHEPTRYYGVQRNGVETAIIPTTWREGALALQGRLDAGWRWDAGLTTGFDLSRWDASSSEGRESPLGSIHQEGSLAQARHLSGFLAVNYTGVPGLRVGAGAFGGSTAQSSDAAAGTGLALWEAHATWQAGGWDLAGLYASGRISGTRRLNAALPGSTTPVPEAFAGGYLQAAWRSAWGLAPFLRWERYDTGLSYARLAPAPTPAPLPWTEAWIGGANYALAPGVVLKGDYARYTSGEAPDRIELGIGWEF